MCLRKHTDWSCGHHTIRLSQCNSEPADRGCFAIFFGSRACPAEDLFCIRDRRCPSCCERRETSERRSVEREARRREMRASYEAHRSSTGSSRASSLRSVRQEQIPETRADRLNWEPVVPGVMPSIPTAKVRGPAPPLYQAPPLSSFSKNGQVPRETYRGPTVGYQWDPVPPSGGRPSRRVNGPYVRSPGCMWDPVVPQGGYGRAPEWTSVPLA